MINLLRKELSKGENFLRIIVLILTIFIGIMPALFPLLMTQLMGVNLIDAAYVSDFSVNVILRLAIIPVFWGVIGIFLNRVHTFREIFWVLFFNIVVSLLILLEISVISFCIRDSYYPYY